MWLGLQYRFTLQVDSREGEHVSLAFESEEEAGIWHRALQEAINSRAGDANGSSVSQEGQVPETPRIVRLPRPFRRNRSLTLSIDLGSPPAEGHSPSPVIPLPTIPATPCNPSNLLRVEGTHHAEPRYQ